jgi:poly-beta-1,6-N-acetyl-D-glucosamine synthase
MSNSFSTQRRNSTYVLITAAYNEEAYIDGTINAVLSQTVRPARWVIVSDGSVDRTDEIVQRYTGEHSFIQFIRREKDGAEGFASKVFALHTALESLSGAAYDFIGHLDADITLPASYFDELFRVFEENPLLGLSGGSLLENVQGSFVPRGTGTTASVPGAVQMFRRACYDAIGGFIPIPYGGEDWYAEIAARMKGWQVRTVPDLLAYHHRPTGKATGRLRYSYRQGLMDYALGSHPIFEAAKLLRRISNKPYVLVAAARWLGFLVAHFTTDRAVSQEFMDFLRNEQMRRLRVFQWSPRHSSTV